MITIKNIEVCYWRNRFADQPVVLVTTDSDGTVSQLNFNRDALRIVGNRFPAAHTGLGGPTTPCFLAALCLSMQQEMFDLPSIAGASGGQFWFAAIDPFYAFAVARHAVAFLNWATNRPQASPEEITAALGQFIDQCEPLALDQSIRALLTEADVRGIPWFRIDQLWRDVQLGQGLHQQRMRETVRGNESLLAAAYARDKGLTCNLLSAVGLPVGRFGAVSTPYEAVNLAGIIGFPVVLKPTYGKKGTDVVIGLTNPQAVHETAKKLLAKTPQLLVQSFIPGDDHRLLVVSGRLVAAACRSPASVLGDGKHNIGQLIESANADPRRGKGFSKLMNYIEIDDELRRVLTGQGYTLSTVPCSGTTVRLRLTANISTGGTAVDVTATIHPDNARLAERAALTIGLTVAGVDFITPDITRSWREVGGGICELNVAVGLRAHWLANPSQDVVGPILDTIFPLGKDGRVPTALVTGSNGKTTTTRMLDHILRAAGYIVGSATTDGVSINGDMILEGDLAGPTGASIILRDPTVSAAVLETARGGIIKYGIYVDRCDVAALLNIDREQVEMDGIGSLDDMMKLKRKVIDTAQDAVILNAEDRRCLEISRELPSSRTILFSLDPSSQGILAHIAAGGTAVTLMEVGGQKTIVIRDQCGAKPVAAADTIPASYGGLVRHNVANAVAAVALAYGMQVPIENIAAGLSEFNPSLEHSPGRFNVLDGFSTRVLIDLASNPPALRAAVQAIDRFPCAGRRICVFTTPGNRPDKQIEECARAVADHFDRYVCFDRADWRRGRAPGDIARSLEQGLIEAGVSRDQIASALTQQDALVIAARTAKPDDFLVVLGTEVKQSLPDLRRAFALAAGKRHS